MNETASESEVFSLITHIDEKVKNLTQLLSPISRNFPSESEKTPEPPTELSKRLTLIERNLNYLIDSIVL